MTKLTRQNVRKSVLVFVHRKDSGDKSVWTDESAELLDKGEGIDALRNTARPQMFRVISINLVA